jgi:serine/threonine-protein kinase
MKPADALNPPLGPTVVKAPGLPRCRVAGSWAASSLYRGEVGQLLLNRLRLASVITLLPLFLFLVRHLTESTHDAMLHRVTLAFHCAVTVLLAALAVLLHLRRGWQLRELRAVELAVFGSLAAYFAWLQFGMFCQDMPLPPGQPVTPGVPRLVVLATAVRWFFLIVSYGVFIPNTWRRCALVVGAGALLPLAITPLSAAAHGRFTPELHRALGDLAIVTGTAVAVAVFGSYRLQVLQEQAFEAQQLGQYRLKQRLGAGGMGEVYLAEHVLLRRPCAVKLIRAGKGVRPETLRRFEREVQAMAALTHPNTAQVFDYGHADDGTFYYVMEYLPGLNLEALVGRHGPLQPGRAIHFLRQVCAALREAHGVGLLHRDIKPGNVIACERGGAHDVAKLLDFGLVQDLGLGRGAERLTVEGTVLGSPPYMSPEQAAGLENLDARSDLYSVGGLGYFLLTGQPPFARDTAMQMLLAHAYEAVVPPNKLQGAVPADLEAVILRCLEKKPEGRFASADALEKALAGCRNAGGWGEEEAAAWWRAHGADADTGTHSVLRETPRT